VSALFSAGAFRAIEMTPADVPALQRFFETNPGYHVAMNGEAPGSGAAQEEFDQQPPAGWPFEKRWLRLGVVIGNSRAERFWEKAGYQDVRKRDGVEMGKRINTLRVMAKPLGEPDWAAHLASVPRDRLETP